MTWDSGHERLERDRLLARLLDLGIDAPVVPYPAHASIEEGKRLRGALPGAFTKNLLLKDKKGRLFFVTAFEDTDVDLKTLHTRIGAQGRLGFASPDAMAELLRVHPGTATPLGLMNDTENAVTLVVDEALLAAEQLNFHPMTHREHRPDLAAVPRLRGLLRTRTARRAPRVIVRKDRARPS